MADQDDELADAVRELTRTIDDLRAELESSRGRSPFRPPAPRPPTPRDLLDFTDEVAIPAAVAVLETSVRALEGFQRALRLARTEREVRDRTTDATRTAGERADDLRQSTLSRLDTVLAELQRATSEGTLPADEGARELLSEARELRDDVERRLREAGEDLESRESRERRESGATGGDVVRIDIEDGDLGDDAESDSPETDADANPDPSVDVDAELETLKDQYGNDDADADASDATDDSTDTSDAAADSTDTSDAAADSTDASNATADDTDGSDDAADDSDADENGSDGA